MPYQSKRQWRMFFAKEKRGELPEGTARKWAEHTATSYSHLPERVGSPGGQRSQRRVSAVRLAARRAMRRATTRIR